MNEKRQALLETALGLFYSHGVQSIGINEVLKVSGIAKKTLYHHFPSKEALVLAALKERNRRFLAWLEPQLAKGETDAEVVENLFEALDAWIHDDAKELGKFRGCFFVNTSAEFGDVNSDIAQYCRLHKQQVRARIGHYLVSKDEAFLDSICLLKEGAISSAYVSNDLEAAIKGLRAAKALIA
ncbi:TetR/AcrR family transcriptional regulator [Saccharospirillum mangrovi]|uniref:TetR/AcrR family transcriptional regulator n=1 Tax=Saccharospirillum mangrovi TaxID=2161747 RepID=UPI000D396E23|nr:TetR/AcrR family transcriptional regulator [Saccharospirillum mangrovi]